jgi:hypothetical protein
METVFKEATQAGEIVSTGGFAIVWRLKSPRRVFVLDNV